MPPLPASTSDDPPAIERFEIAVKLDPSRPLPLNDLARALATHPDRAMRDGKRAIALAAQASELLQHGDPEVLDTLACAYAEAGDFGRAIKTADIALSLARSTGANRLARALEQHKRLFESETPYREP